MAFGQAGGPPAGRNQMAELLALVEAAGYEGFRDARHPLGLTQRQSNGKFTVAEADELIARLTDDGVSSGSGAPERPAAAPRPERMTADERRARELPDHVLAAELQRRGWAVLEP